MHHAARGGAIGPDDDFTARGMSRIGTWILGRNMFGPVREHSG
jgi:dihydrofolate reductase